MTKENYLLRDESDRIAELEAEVTRLRHIEFAWNEWQDKTEWVQKSAKPRELGMHRADVLRGRVEKAESQATYEFSERELATIQRDEAWDREAKYKAQRDKLLEALKKVVKANGGSDCYTDEDDEIGRRACCGELSYEPHDPDCYVSVARAAIAEVKGK